MYRRHDTDVRGVRRLCDRFGLTVGGAGRYARPAGPGQRGHPVTRSPRHWQTVLVNAEERLFTARQPGQDPVRIQVSISGSSLPGRSIGPGGNFPGARNIHVGVQRVYRKDRPVELLGLTPGDAPSARWDFEATATPAGAGFDIKGTYIQGRPGARFIYLAWGARRRRRVQHVPPGEAPARRHRPRHPRCRPPARIGSSRTWNSPTPRATRCAPPSGRPSSAGRQHPPADPQHSPQAPRRFRGSQRQPKIARPGQGFLT